MIARPNLGLYVHWPFCKDKCPYCDFNSHVSSAHDNDTFCTSLCNEMSYMATLLPGQRVLTSMFFGGGTPSLMPPEIVAKIINHAKKTFGFSSTIEITAEANPTSIEANKMTEFFHAGVNRLSMGVQSVDDKILKFLGRAHSATEALSALQEVRKNFDNLSIDLIYATANQTFESWRTQLSQILDLNLPHLSLYQLTIEPGTVFYSRQRRGEQLSLDDDHAADLFELTQFMTAEAGLSAYEISNHAKTGMACQHNLNYWRSGDWVGIGPGAHSRFCMMSDNQCGLSRIGVVTRRNPKSWQDSVTKNGHGIDLKLADHPSEFAAEMMMMGLRLSEGVQIDRIEELCGPKDSWLDQSALENAITAGWLALQKTGNKTQLLSTSNGRLRLNQVLAMVLQ